MIGIEEVNFLDYVHEISKFVHAVMMLVYVMASCLAFCLRVLNKACIIHKIHVLEELHLPILEWLSKCSSKSLVIEYSLIILHHSALGAYKWSKDINFFKINYVTNCENRLYLLCLQHQKSRAYLWLLHVDDFSLTIFS